MEEENQRPTGEGEHHEHRKASSTELFSSAKLVAGAAQSAFSGKSDSIDKSGVAGAAEDLLGAAKEYGNLDESSGVGQYVGKAEGYLHSYHSSGSKPGVGREGEEEKAPVSEERREEEKEKAPVSEERREEEREETKAGGGVGDYVNMAKGFFS